MRPKFEQKEEAQLLKHFVSEEKGLDIDVATSNWKMRTFAKCSKLDCHESSRLTMATRKRAAVSIGISQHSNAERCSSADLHFEFRWIVQCM